MHEVHALSCTYGLGLAAEERTIEWNFSNAAEDTSNSRDIGGEFDKLSLILRVEFKIANMERSFKTILVVVLLGVCDLSMEQRVPPGVPPQHYQAPQGQPYQPPPQQYQQGQVPIQQGQAPGQIPIQNLHHGQGQVHPHGQVPIQQQQQQGQIPIQQYQQGQVPVQQQAQVPGQVLGQPAHVPGQGHHGAGHGHHAPHGQLLDASNVDKERQHIQEHMDLPIDTSKMSEQELQFHYFKMHDADNNNKLDGCELVKSLIHWHDQANHDPNAGVPIPEAKVFNDEELTNMIDPILNNDDKNKDGFIDYAEFVQAQATAATRQADNNNIDIIYTRLI
ncbi:unnamed protein product [Allacma fusca]|uniref:EF-hand domain-containing protein n=1 Tax=Allacma fusca TaxID=39272 RepID=A0A8J2Q2N5_9HEXA|nr:unnamed protein product [Allacma fusca]